MKSGATPSRAKMMPAIARFPVTSRLRLLAGLVGRRLTRFCGRNLLATYDLVRSELEKGSLVGSQPPYWAIDSARWKLLVRPFSSDAIIVDEVLLRRSYAPLLAIVEALALDVRFVVDAGANIGTFTLFIKDAFPDASVVALEPEPENFRLLAETIAANSLAGVRLVEAALWGENGTLWIHDDFRGSRERELSFAVTTAEPASRNGENPGVEGISVDSLLDRYGLEIVDVFKIDIEGAERSLFANPTAVADFFRHVRVCAMEIHDEVFDRMTFLQTVERLGLQHVQRGETLYIYRPIPDQRDGHSSVSRSAALP